MQHCVAGHSSGNTPAACQGLYARGLCSTCLTALLAVGDIETRIFCPALRVGQCHSHIAWPCEIAHKGRLYALKAYCGAALPVVHGSCKLCKALAIHNNGDNNNINNSNNHSNNDDHEQVCQPMLGTY